MKQQFLVTVECNKQTDPEDIKEILECSTIMGYFENGFSVEVEEVAKNNTVYQDDFEAAFCSKIDGNKFIKEIGEIVNPNKNQEELKCI